MNMKTRAILETLKFRRICKRFKKLKRILHMLWTIKIILIMGTVCLCLLTIIIYQVRYITFSQHHPKTHQMSQSKRISSTSRNYDTPMRHIPYKEVYNNINTHDEDLSIEIEESKQANMIDTPGCVIPVAMVDYKKKIRKSEGCGKRIIYMKRYDEENVQAIISNIRMAKLLKMNEKYDCCYRFFERSNVGRKHLKLEYTPCQNLRNGEKIKLKSDFINVKCFQYGTTNKSHIIYEDNYVLCKRISLSNAKSNSYEEKYNVLVIGMGSMSLPRLAKTMSRTIHFFQNQNWLSYRGYHKVGDNKLPNLLPILTGKHFTEIIEKCGRKMDDCNDYFLWSLFKNSGYVTAYGEDYLHLPDAFGGEFNFQKPPTDHYMRPFFLNREYEIDNGSLLCSGKITTDFMDILKYIMKYIKITILFVWLPILYTIYSKIGIYRDVMADEIFELDKIHTNWLDDHNLIQTPGCSIPNYAKTYKVKEAKDLKTSCGLRTIFVKKKTDGVVTFMIDKNKMKSYSKHKYSCCYQFISPSINKDKIDVSKIRYSSCTPFENGTETELKEEVIVVTCTAMESSKKDKKKKQTIYKDAYAFVKKKNRTNKKYKTNNNWNVLILGMDTMSRARFYTSMPKTARHLQRYKWLDFRGYQKVAYNTFPNVMALLTGKNLSLIHEKCNLGMNHCNDKIIWTDFKNAGYTTATGEDSLHLPDTFSKYEGFKSSPTDHYLRPLFKTGEQEVGNLVCTGKRSSVNHVLDYALDFLKSYKNRKSFGMFWTNSYSHNLNHIPTLIDEDVVKLLKRLYMDGISENTFIFFLSDHGIRYGDSRIPYESYYEERLPMLFVRVPLRFRKKYVQTYRKMQINQKRLITPYDLYVTFFNIFQTSKRNNTAESCPGCRSIFNEISPYRTCADAGVQDKWCCCHQLKSINTSNHEVTEGVRLAEIHLQNKIKGIKTIHCMKCEVLKINSVIRTHTYTDKVNNTFYVIAFTATPGKVKYEAIVLKRMGNYTVFPMETISTYNTRGNCVKNPNDRAYCVCKSSC